MTHKETIDGFLSALSSWLESYQHATFSFIAFVESGSLVILKGRVHFSTTPVSLPPPPESVSLKVGHAPIESNSVAIATFISELMSGRPFAALPYAALSFLLPPDGVITAYRDPPAAGVVCKTFVERLLLQGHSRWTYWQSKGHLMEKAAVSAGYESIDDLLTQYGFPKLGVTDSLDVEFVAEPVVRFGTPSELRGRTLSMTILMPASLSPVPLLLVVRSDDGGAPIHDVTRGDLITWHTRDSTLVGHATVLLDRAAIVQCRAIYSGTLQDTAQLADPRALPNIRRRILELADPDLLSLRQLLTNPRRDQARALEGGVSTLLYMLGLTPIQSSAATGNTDVADVFAIDGDMLLVVECTLFALDPKDKLSKLIHRVDTIKSQIGEGFKAMTVRGLLVVPQPQDKLVRLKKIAMENDVALIGQAEIAELLEHTRRVCRAEEFFASLAHSGSSSPQR